MNKLLLRQIQKVLGNAGDVPEKYIKLFKVISDSYDHHEKDRTMIERSLELSSSEMVELNANLRKESEQARAAHLELRTLSENIGEALFSVDMVKRKVLQITPTCRALFGYSPEEFHENPDLWFEMIVEEDRELVINNDKTLRDGNSIVNVNRIRKKCGNVRWIETKISPTLNEDGELIRIDGVSSDITDRKNTEIALIESEAQIQAIYAASLDAIIIIDESGKIIKWDSKSEDLFGWKEYEVLGESLSARIIPRQYRAAHERGISHFLQNRSGRIKSRTMEVRAINRQNREFDISLSISPSFIHNKCTFIGFIRDITEKKKAENAVQSSEKRFRSLIENNEDAIGLYDAEGKIIYQSPAVHRITGFLPGERLNKKIWDFMHPDDMEKCRGVYDKIIANPFVAVHFQYRLLHSNGHYVWIEGTGNNLLEDENVSAIVANYRDISLKKEAENAIFESENKYKMLFEKMSDGLYKSTSEGKFIDVNPALVQMLGYSSKEELLAIDIKTQLYFESSDREEALLQDITDGISIFRLRKKDGSEIWVEDRCQYINDEDGKPLYHEGIMRDVTHRKVQQDALKKSNMDLKKSNAELDRFVYSISHDLRAPLLSMLGIIEITESEPEGNQVGEHMTMMKESIKRLDHFIGEILEYSRNSRGEIERDVIDINDMMNEIIADLPGAPSNRNNVDIHVCHTGEARICSDRERLTIILNNLVTNSIIYFDPLQKNPYVKINIDADEKQVRFVVEDNGIGISQEYQDKVFEMFYRISEISTGSGLGLYIVKETVEKLKGVIQVDSAPGKGTRFTLQIPNLFYQ